MLKKQNTTNDRIGMSICVAIIIGFLLVWIFFGNSQVTLVTFIFSTICVVLTIWWFSRNENESIKNFLSGFDSSPLFTKENWDTLMYLYKRGSDEEQKVMKQRVEHVISRELDREFRPSEKIADHLSFLFECSKEFASLFDVSATPYLQSAPNAKNAWPFNFNKEENARERMINLFRRVILKMVTHGLYYHLEYKYDNKDHKPYEEPLYQAYLRSRGEINQILQKRFDEITANLSQENEKELLQVLANIRSISAKYLNGELKMQITDFLSHYLETNVEKIQTEISTVSEEQKEVMWRKIRSWLFLIRERLYIDEFIRFEEPLKNLLEQSGYQPKRMLY